MKILRPNKRKIKIQKMKKIYENSKIIRKHKLYD